MASTDGTRNVRFTVVPTSDHPNGSSDVIYSNGGQEGMILYALLLTV